jgi:hypothetical protein
MNNDASAALFTAQNDRERLLKDQVLKIITSHNLENQRRFIDIVAAESNVSVLDCAAAIAYLYEQSSTVTIPEIVALPKGEKQSKREQPSKHHAIKLVCYRLDLGSQNNVEADQIKKVLVEESGVDIKNITNIRIMESYTLIDMPDEMPQEIFHHLKTTEINGQILDIRRVKKRNKKRTNRKNRHLRPNFLPSAKEAEK